MSLGDMVIILTDSPGVETPAHGEEKRKKREEIETYLQRVAAAEYQKMDNRRSLQDCLIANIFPCGLTAAELSRDSKRKTKATTTQDGKIFIVHQSVNKDYVSVTVSSSSGVTLERKLGIKRGMLSGVLERLGINPTAKKWEVERVFPFWGEQDPQVYFIKGGDWVKIGMSKNPAKRLKALQTASGYPLELLATMRGGHTLERMLQNYFSEYRSSGEWFDAQEVEKFINEFTMKVG